MYKSLLLCGGLLLFTLSCATGPSSEYRDAAAQIQQLTPEQIKSGYSSPALAELEKRVMAAAAADPQYVELQKQTAAARKQLADQGEKLLAGQPEKLAQYKEAMQLNAQCDNQFSFFRQISGNKLQRDYIQKIKQAGTNSLFSNPLYKQLFFKYFLSYDELSNYKAYLEKASPVPALAEVRHLQQLYTNTIFKNQLTALLAGAKPAAVTGSPEFVLAMTALDVIRKSSAQPNLKTLELQLTAEHLLKSKAFDAVAEQDPVRWQLERQQLNFKQFRSKQLLEILKTNPNPEQALRQSQNDPVLKKKIQENRDLLTAREKRLQELVDQSPTPEAQEYRQFLAAEKTLPPPPNSSCCRPAKPLNWNNVLVKTASFQNDFRRQARALFEPKFQKEIPSLSTNALDLPWAERPDPQTLREMLSRPEIANSVYFAFFLRSRLARVADDQPNRTAFLQLADKLLYHAQPLTHSEAMVVVRYLPSIGIGESHEKVAKLTAPAATASNLDPWLREVLQGIHAVEKSWQARGHGWASQVTQDGWNVFGAEQDKAREHYRKAMVLGPTSPLPYVAMLGLETASGNCNDKNAVLNYFRQATEQQADYASAYLALLNSFRPRWGGEPAMSYALAMRCFDSPWPDSKVPQAGVWAVVSGASEDSEYRWQRGIRNTPTLKEKMAATLQRRYRSAATPDAQDDAMVQQISLAAAVGDYVGAKKLFDQMTPASFAAAQKRLDAEVRDGLNTKLNYFSWLDYPSMLRVFTGPEGRELKKLEDRFIAGETDSAVKDLAAMIRSGKFQGADKDFLIDLYGRWRLNVDCTYYRAMFPVWRMIAWWKNAKLGSTDIIFDQIELGLSPGTVGFNRYTPLMCVLELPGPKEKVARVVELSGPYVNQPDRQGWTSLHYAVKFRDADIVRMIVIKGANLNAGDKDNTTALMITALDGMPDKMKILLDAGADPAIKQTDGQTALSMAEKNHHPECAAILKKALAAGKK